jgi:hypothetical protein
LLYEVWAVGTAVNPPMISWKSIGAMLVNYNYCYITIQVGQVVNIIHTLVPMHNMVHNMSEHVYRRALPNTLYTIILYYTIVIIIILLYAPCIGTAATGTTVYKHNVIMYERHEKMTSERWLQAVLAIYARIPI